MFFRFAETFKTGTTNGSVGRGTILFRLCSDGWVKCRVWVGALLPLSPKATTLNVLCSLTDNFCFCRRGRCDVKLTHSVAQQSYLSRPSSFPKLEHPTPPHWPQPAAQHAPLEAWMPMKPLSHVEAVARVADKRKPFARKSRPGNHPFGWCLSISAQGNAVNEHAPGLKPYTSRIRWR